MSPLLNEPPACPPDCPARFSKLAAEAREQGHAFPFAISEAASLLIFSDVDDHIDGNGHCALWLLQGSGRFFLDGGAVALRPGDAVIFDDRSEHGFESDSIEPCVALNTAVDPRLHSDPEGLRALLQALSLGPLFKSDPAPPLNPSAPRPGP